jgi:glycerol kinase
MRDFAQAWACDRRFSPSMDETERQTKIIGWKTAVSRMISDASAG